MGFICAGDLDKKHRTADKKQSNACQFKSFNKKLRHFDSLANRAVRHLAGLAVMIKAVGG